MAIKAGDLRDLVTIKYRPNARSGLGTAVTVRTQWCQIAQLSGRELEVADATNQEIDVRMQFRVLPAIVRNDSSGNVYFIVDADGTEYDIEHVLTHRPPDARQEVYCRIIAR